MAGIAEMALGIATTLRSGIAPYPLPVELWGYAPEDAAQLVKFAIDECVDAGIVLREIRVDPVIVHELTGSKSEFGVFHRDVPISADTACRGRVDIYRAKTESRGL
ncbi:hypothetical protein [Sphingomonas sp.]|uniref:hypothetical protein n=1 Tax=Sphingomonas sp. TaxID=28214 RepID=UPI0017954A31|nr:hypothetical protein [Sphingomonas sp.]MBA3510457.1 hypothetical protein [Sphingomonas sp.]